MSFASECISNFTEIITKKYCQFSGRARRREFWMYTLTVWVISFIISLIDKLLHLQIDVPNGQDIGILSVILSLALLLPGLALDVRRLHDIGKEWYWLFIVLIPIAGPIWLLVLDCKEGDRFDNSFGPDPKAEPAFVPGDNPPAV
ncbi:MAG: DUF805 domain-containing protein [Abditibacteriota bacterium]|jgi:uncharacterized membrane protein YhaH (DUF805 family)|nr:DUF805 domain-containing protein [Abditibacteriota bacterium]